MTTDLSALQRNDMPPPQPEISAVNRRLVRLVAALLLLQGVGLMAMAYWLLSGVDFPIDIATLPTMSGIVETIVFAGIIGFLGLLVFLASIGLFLIRPGAWLVALLLQVFLLLIALNEYFFPNELWQPTNILYGIMASCIVLVFYLNMNDVRQSIKQKLGKQETDHAERSA